MAMATNAGAYYQCHPLTGRCIHHPEVQLRKRKVFLPGTGVVLKWSSRMLQCPQCVLDALSATQQQQDEDVQNKIGTDIIKPKKSSRRGRSSRTKSSSHKKGNGNVDENMRTSPQKIEVFIESKGHGLNDSTISGLSATFHSFISNDDNNGAVSDVDSECSEPRSLSPQSRPSRHAAKELAKQRKKKVSKASSYCAERNVKSSIEQREHVVACSIPLQDAHSKQSCSYTGQVDLVSQLPDGVGTLDYEGNSNYGSVWGEWRMGELICSETSPASVGIRVESIIVPAASLMPAPLPRSLVASLSKGITMPTGSGSLASYDGSTKSNLEQLADLDNFNSSMHSMNSSTSSQEHSGKELPAQISFTNSCSLLPGMFKDDNGPANRSSRSSSSVNSVGMNKAKIPLEDTNQKRIASEDRFLQQGRLSSSIHSLDPGKKFEKRHNDRSVCSEPMRSSSPPPSFEVSQLLLAIDKRKKKSKKARKGKFSVGECASSAKSQSFKAHNELAVGRKVGRRNSDRSVCSAPVVVDTLLTPVGFTSSLSAIDKHKEKLKKGCKKRRNTRKIQVPSENPSFKAHDPVDRRVERRNSDRSIWKEYKGGASSANQASKPHDLVGKKLERRNSDRSICSAPVMSTLSPVMVDEVSQLLLSIDKRKKKSSEERKRRSKKKNYQEVLANLLAVPSLSPSSPGMASPSCQGNESLSVSAHSMPFHGDHKGTPRQSDLRRSSLNCGSVTSVSSTSHRVHWSDKTAGNRAGHGQKMNHSYHL